MAKGIIIGIAVAIAIGIGAVVAFSAMNNDSTEPTDQTGPSELSVDLNESIGVSDVPTDEIIEIEEPEESPEEETSGRELSVELTESIGVATNP